ncbi:hypothetical protein ACLB2K_011766 [Fragaria x ananassa]
MAGHTRGRDVLSHVPDRHFRPGKKGEGVLKTTPGFQRKTASTSNRTTQLESEVERLREQQAAQTATHAAQTSRQPILPRYMPPSRPSNNRCLLG